MISSPIIVIGETPSLAEALVELLRSTGRSVERVGSFREAELLRDMGPRFPTPVLISASNGHACESLERWNRGSLRDSPLVVVGTRDQRLRSAPGLHVVSLPLVPRELLELVDDLSLRAAGRSPA